MDKENLIKTLENEWQIFSHAYTNNANYEWFIKWLTSRLGYSFINELKKNDLLDKGDK